MFAEERPESKKRNFQVRSAAELFLAYAEQEARRRRDSGDAFDELMHKEAVELVKRYLQPGEGEGGL